MKIIFLLVSFESVSLSLCDACDSNYSDCDTNFDVLKLLSVGSNLCLFCL